MAKFKAKPVVIQHAQQWWPPSDERHDAKAHPVLEQRGVGVAMGQIVRLGGLSYQIYTRQGFVTLEPGDWIIERPDGERYPCKPDARSPA